MPEIYKVLNIRQYALEQCLNIQSHIQNPVRYLRWSALIIALQLIY